MTMSAADDPVSGLCLPSRRVSVVRWRGSTSHIESDLFTAMLIVTVGGATA